MKLHLLHITYKSLGNSSKPRKEFLQDTPYQEQEQTEVNYVHVFLSNLISWYCNFEKRISKLGMHKQSN